MKGAAVDTPAEFMSKHGALTKRFFDSIEGSHARLIAKIREIAEIPAPTFSEEKRTEYMKKAFAQCGLHDVHSLSKGAWGP